MNIIRKIKSFVFKPICMSHTIKCSSYERLKIIVDMFYCRIFLHCSYDEYIMYKFYLFRNLYRKNFYLVYHQRNCLHHINTSGFTRSKFDFYRKISEFYSRDILLAPNCGFNKFLDLVLTHGKIIVKPDAGTYGRGIEVFQYSTVEDSYRFFSSISSNVVCEEYISQHHLLAKLNPSCVNSIRVVSLLKDNSVYLLSAALKTGSVEGSVVDNMHSDGIGAQIDIDTGVVLSHGFDYNGIKYIEHPLTKVKFLGFQIPNWSMVVDLVNRAHMKLPECSLLGWDIAVTENGADIIEANNAPGPLLSQFFDKIPKGELILQLIKQHK